MLNAMPRRGPLAVLIALLLAGGAALLLFVTAHPPKAAADTNNNNIVCKGTTSKGAPDPNDDTSTGVAYMIRCNGPITGYSVLPEHQVEGYETEIFAFDPLGQNIVPTDAFACQGDIPGYGVNCVGTYGGFFRQIRGEFFIDGKNSLCQEPRVDPLVVVTTATINSKGAAVTAMAGPFDLGRPRGCAPSKGKRRIPGSSSGGQVLTGDGTP